MVGALGPSGQSIATGAFKQRSDHIPHCHCQLFYAYIVIYSFNII